MQRERTLTPGQQTTPAPKRKDEGVAITPGKTMSVKIPLPAEGQVGRVDGLIEDLMNAFLGNNPDKCAMQPQVVPLAMHVTSCPHV